MRKFRTNFFAATAILCALFIGAMSFCCGLTKEQKEEQTKAGVESTLSAAQEAIDALNFENAEEAAKIDSSQMHYRLSIQKKFTLSAIP